MKALPEIKEDHQNPIRQHKETRRLRKRSLGKYLHKFNPFRTQRGMLPKIESPHFIETFMLQSVTIIHMVKKIPKDGRIVRIKKEMLELLYPYDTDVNTAVLKMKAEIETNRALNLLPNQQPANAQQPVIIPHPCKFDEGTMITAIKQGIKETLESFRE